MLLLRKEVSGDMFMKPKSTTQNPRALLYKRYTNIEKSNSLKAVYKTSDNKYWIFNYENLEHPFEKVEPTGFPLNVTSSTRLSYSTLDITVVYKYTNKWVQANDTPNLSAKFSNIGKYQTNKYYYAGSFDYVKKGAIEGSTTQYIKGNIMPITSMSIQHYNDYIHLEQDDLVVINKHLFAVQNPVEDHKHQPKDFTIYSADLISIL